MAQLDRRGHHHLRILFIDLFDLWNRMFIDTEWPRQTGGRRFSGRMRHLPTSLAAALLGSILACGGGGATADKVGSPLAAPLITSQPSSQTVTAGASASFTVAASGNPAPTYTWERSHDSGGTWAAISAANAATYAFTAAKADHQAQFRARAANTVNTAISDAATLSVRWLDITAQPAGQAVTAPAATTFAITVDANPAAIFQWQGSSDGTRWSALSGATGTSYTTGPTTLSDSGRQFRCMVTNAARELASDPAILTVNAPLAAPAFTVQPASQTVTAGSNAIFIVAASGNPSPTFAWERSNDGGGAWAAISGAISATYTFTAQLSDHAAQFRAKASNSVDTAVSEVATLSISSMSIPIPDATSPGNLVALDLIAIPSGRFIMGSPDAETDRYPDEGPQHQVTISRAFYMAKFECTRVQWLAVMGTDPSQAAGGLQFPVDTVHYNAISWPVAGFMDKLNAATQGVRPDGLTFRLPTEAEWEYACRAGSNTPFYFGNDYPISTLHNHAWYSNNSGGTTHPVGQKSPNVGVCTTC